MPYSVIPRWRRRQLWELVTWRTRGITLLNTNTLYCQAICWHPRAERQLVRQEHWPCFLSPETTDDRRPTTSRSCSSALPSFRGQLRLSVDPGPSVFEQTGVALGTCRMWMMPWSTTSLNRGVGQNGGLQSADVVAGLAAGATPNVTVGPVTQSKPFRK